MNTKKHYIALTSVMTAIILTAATAIIGIFYLDTTTYRLMQKADQYDRKNNLVLTLWEVQNQRTHILQSMLLEPDPFERDNFYLAHLAQATRFIETRASILEMEMTAAEKRLINGFNGLVREVQPIQDQLVQLAFEGKDVEAHTIMQTADYVKLRTRFNQQFQAMMSYYRAKTHQSFNETITVGLNNIHFILILTAGVLLFCATVGYFMTRRIVDADNKLRDEVARHVETQTALEIHRQHLEEEVQKEVEKHKQIEEARNKSQELAYAMGQILEDSLNEIYIFDAGSLQFIQVNKAARDNTGYSMAELKKLTPIELSHLLSRDDFREIIQPLLNGSEDIIHFTSKLDRKNGSTYPVEMHLQLSMMEYSPVIVAMVQDITERKRIEEFLLYKTTELDVAENELEYQKKALDEHAIVSVMSKSECLVSVNQKFIELSGFSEEELIGGNFCIGTTADEPEAFFNEMSATIQGGDVWHGIMSNKRADGTPYWTQTTITPFLDTNGNIEKFISISTDFTAQKLAEQELINKTIEVEEAHKALEASHAQALQSEKLASVGQLAAGIAHEINTPIQFVGDNTRFLEEAFEDLTDLISTYQEQCDAIKEGTTTPDMADKARQKSEEIDLEYLAEEVPNAITQSLEGIERVTKIVRSMKDFSHPGSDSKEVIDINNAIDSTTTVCKNEWKYDAELVLDYDPRLTSVPCFPGELNQVMLNIIVNASHAIHDTREGNSALGTIKISTRLSGKFAEIRISDNGSGMPEHVRKRIFEPFFTTKGVGKGSGQGLAIAYSVIVEKHNGTLDVESEPGVGTTFIIKLPLDDIEIIEQETGHDTTMKTGTA